MTPLAKGLVVAFVQVALVATLGAKLLYDRATLPRVWALTLPYDPDLPIRGRYVSLRLAVHAPELPSDQRDSLHPVSLKVEDGRLVAQPVGKAGDYRASRLFVRYVRDAGDNVVMLDDPVAFFISENVQDPSVRAQGERLWVEVTVPRRGPPRPIRLGVKRGDAPIEPLELR